MQRIGAGCAGALPLLEHAGERWPWRPGRLVSARRNPHDVHRHRRHRACQQEDPERQQGQHRNGHPAAARQRKRVGQGKHGQVRQRPDHQRQRQNRRRRPWKGDAQRGGQAVTAEGDCAEGLSGAEGEQHQPEPEQSPGETVMERGVEHQLADDRQLVARHDLRARWARREPALPDQRPPDRHPQQHEDGERYRPTQRDRQVAQRRIQRFEHHGCDDGEQKHQSRRPQMPPIDRQRR